MKQSMIRSHIREGSYRKSFYYSLAGHLVLLLCFTVGVSFLPAPDPIQIGSGKGGGQSGEFVTVHLSADAGGGEGLYKPGLVPARPAALPAPAEQTPTIPEPPPSEEVFVEKSKSKKKPVEKKEPVVADEQTKPVSTPAEPLQTAKKDGEKSSEKPDTAQIPRRPDPGTGGPGSSSGGSGGGMGGGQGVLVGGGSTEGEIDSWYVRQVERRIGQNWLKTSLGNLQGEVESVVTFEVRSGGQITQMQFEKRSGIGSVDLAVQRALEASNPLPPLPYEMRKRTVRFRAVFQYPPR